MVLSTSAVSLLFAALVFEAYADGNVAFSDFMYKIADGEAA